MKPEEFNKIVDRAVAATRDPDEARTRHQDTVNNVLLGRIAQLEADVGYLRGGTAWNDVAQKMLTFERKLSELTELVNPRAENLKARDNSTIWCIFFDDKGNLTVGTGLVEWWSEDNDIYRVDVDCLQEYLHVYRKDMYETKEEAINALRAMVEEACK